MMKPDKVYYYTDEINDEFSGVQRNTVSIDNSYQYIHNNIIWRIVSSILYRIIMTPIAWLYLKIKFQVKFVNRNIIKEYCKKNKKGFFLYGNHTQMPGDGFFPSIITFPVRDFVIVNADNISLKGTRTFMEMVGACVLPNKLSGMKNFLKAVEKRINDGNCVAVYPEAHIWPYYTGIRPFKSDSFALPKMFAVPSFCFTVTYQKKKKRKQPVITVFIDGPFLPDNGMDKKTAQKNLRNQIYETMIQRSKSSNYEYVKYIKRNE